MWNKWWSKWWRGWINIQRTSSTGSTQPRMSLPSGSLRCISNMMTSLLRYGWMQIPARFCRIIINSRIRMILDRLKIMNQRRKYFEKCRKYRWIILFIHTWKRQTLTIKKRWACGSSIRTSCSTKAAWLRWRLRSINMAMSAPCWATVWIMGSRSKHMTGIWS